MLLSVEFWLTRRGIVLIASSFICLHVSLARDWPQWRGTSGDGSAGATAVPAEFGPETNLLWKVDLPGKGCSTPVVWNQQIYLTAPSNGQDCVLSYDKSGRQRWQKPLGLERPGKNRNGSGCNPSPATDGQSVFVYFKSGTLAALDLNGGVQWKTNLIERYGKETLYWDYGTSPVLTRDDVVVSQMHHGESWLAAFNKRSGELHWKVARNYQTPDENDHSYATPIVIQEGGREVILVWGAEHLTAHAASNGEMLWSCGDFNPRAQPNWVAVSSPVVVGNVAVIPFGRGTVLYGVRLGGTGDVTKTHRLWERQNLGTFVPTPAAYEGKVYVVRDRGEVECIDPETGKSVWSGAFPKGSPNYYASPAVAGGLLYAPREDGVVFVGDIRNGLEVLAQNPMREPIIASPVPMEDRLILRGEKHLFCFGRSEAKAVAQGERP